LFCLLDISEENISVQSFGKSGGILKFFTFTKFYS
jgi:hypothetical protein